jgi:hypothetical protein
MPFYCLTYSLLKLLSSLLKFKKYIKIMTKNLALQAIK